MNIEIISGIRPKTVLDVTNLLFRQILICTWMLNRCTHINLMITTFTIHVICWYQPVILNMWKGNDAPTFFFSVIMLISPIDSEL